MRKQLPWHPAPYDEAVTGAIKALQAGTANAGQQQRALKWIIEALCGTYDLSYRPDPSATALSPRASASWACRSSSN
jgi:hypothetical protein